MMMNLKNLMLRMKINKLEIINILLNMNVILYYHALYKINKLSWLSWMYELKLIDFNGKEYSRIILWKEAKVVSNTKLLVKWIIFEHKIEYEVKMTDEKVQVIQSDYLKAQLSSNHFKSLTVQMRQNKLSDLLKFYFITVILRKLKIIK